MCAAVTDTGALYMWGSLLTRGRVQVLAQALKVKSLKQLLNAADWEGFGCEEPTLVLDEGVADVALGQEHALVLFK